ncbi:hypothetical protein GCG54_00015338 [Colletotrichum gloeosporioides]|uniref:Uncharacterized protein n=1 Tax=Colletotrichum gloeosporioides TaxID=474922 RepID=A0A8H4C8L1_COLGL|nr:uncharacterized protein GCG54_00015338 [Colletotrichum gloeosporioides]KAF3799152.1 hypothetical protein GCG54_00015338 [Colletotrichum gloeosporioides]
MAHHQALRHQLGNIAYVVRFEVDAYYEKAGEISSAESLEGAMGRLAVEESSGGSVKPRPSWPSNISP